MARKRGGAAILTAEQLEQSIHVVRGVRVMLDSDLARLYGVTTSTLNQAVRRNRARFPNDFAYQLTQQEFANLISQTATSSLGHGGRRKLPWVFTEHGVAALACVLRSPTAILVNIEIVRAFIRIRRLLGTSGELVEQLQRLAQTVQLHDDQIKAITQVLRQMIAPPKEESGRRIGFQTPPADAPESTTQEPDEGAAT
jgi:ORF6N domain